MSGLTDERLRERIAALHARGDRVILPVALGQAATVIEHLKAHPTAQRVELAGDLRRRVETVDRLDVVVASTDVAAMIATARNKAIFEKLDADHNGSLTAAEFARLGPPPMKANPEALMAQMDGNKDGKVTKAEHAAAGKARFTQLDTNKDGVLTEAEARAAAAREK